MLSFIELPSPVHRLSGAVKLILFLLWSILAMASYDTRVMALMAVAGCVLFKISKLRLKDVSFIFKMLIFFMAVNLLMIYVISPQYATTLYKTRHVLLPLPGRWAITAEQVFYETNILLKYIVMVPAAILLIVTTNPSEFAASLNRVGVSYYISYAVSLTLRYIPDVQRDYETISQAQAARGIELSKKAPLIKRLKAVSRILLPLIVSSIDRIDEIAHAMELRSFGKHKKRTWYRAAPFSRADKATLAAGTILFALLMWLSFKTGARFWNPFGGEGWGMRITLPLPSRKRLLGIKNLNLHTDTISGSDYSASIFKLAREYSLTCYDAAYLELAIRTGAGVATLDGDFREACIRAGL
jgi:energy-coupling factor transport system permease protein